VEKYKKVAGDIKTEDGSAFYRTELETPWNFNPGQLCGYNGISCYSSTMSKAAYDFFVNMGMFVYAKNLSTRYDKSCAADVFLGVKYRIYNDKGGAGYTKNEATLPVGYSIKAESCEKLIKLLNDKSADYGTVKSFIDENVLGKMYDISVGNGWHGLAGKNEYISGNIMTRSGILVISLPYNEGWSIYIDEDGKPCRIHDYDKHRKRDTPYRNEAQNKGTWHWSGHKYSGNCGGGYILSQEKLIVRNSTL